MSHFILSNSRREVQRLIDVLVRLLYFVYWIRLEIDFTCLTFCLSQDLLVHVHFSFHEYFRLSYNNRCRFPISIMFLMLGRFTDFACFECMHERRNQNKNLGSESKTSWSSSWYRSSGSWQIYKTAWLCQSTIPLNVWSRHCLIMDSLLKLDSLTWCWSTSFCH